MSKFIDRIKQNQIPYIHTRDLFTGVPGTTLYRPYRGTDGVPSALRDEFILATNSLYAVVCYVLDYRSLAPRQAREALDWKGYQDV